MVSLGVADGVISECMGGAHHDWTLLSKEMKKKILQDLKLYSKMDSEKIREERYLKFRQMGQFEA